MKKGISIIIPCYNVEKYLSRCIDSILNQTYKDYEIIMVDDCSTDNTWSIINQYSKNYSNCIAIKNEKNSGAGYSRNKALEIAKYDYISFIDSDDYIEDNFYLELLNSIEKEESDVAVCDIYVRYIDGETQDVRSSASQDPSDKYWFINNGLAASPCNKIFKREQLLKYPFAEGIMNEDVPTVLAILINCSKIAYCKSTYYNYVQHKNSIQNKNLSDKKLDIFKALDLLEERVPRNEQNNKYWTAIVFNQLIMFLIYVIPKDDSFLERKKFLKKFYKLCLKYDIYKNNLWWDFLADQGKYHNIYYRFYIKFLRMRCYFLASLIISMYKFYNKHLKKPIIKENINMNDLIKLSKRQQMMKDRYNISVVIPNYNYEQFLYQRLYSILNQKIKVSEIIILDDCSTDNSRLIIDEIVKKLNKYINIKSVYNETNSGSAFKQWRKGFEIANGEYIWIAEADDYCNCNFLKEIVKPIKKDKDVVISYSDTAFINKDGMMILRTIKPEIDIMKTGHWDTNFINDGKNEIKNYSFLNCTIANVSSVLFKKNNYSKYFEESGKFKQAGDWLFYVNVMSQGKIAFCNKALNYYRVHGNNVTSTTKKQAHFDEIKLVHKSINKKMEFNEFQKNEIEKRYSFLAKVWDIKLH